MAMAMSLLRPPAGWHSCRPMQRTLRTIHLTNRKLRPMGVVVTPDNKTLYVATGRGQSVVAMDTSTGQQIGAVEVGARPWGIAQSPDGHYLFTANGPSNDVSIVEARTMTLVRRVSAGTGPWRICVVATKNRERN